MDALDAFLKEHLNAEALAQTNLPIDILNGEILGNSVFRYALGAVLLVVFYVLGHVVMRVYRRAVNGLFQAKFPAFAETLIVEFQRPVLHLVSTLGLFVGATALNAEPGKHWVRTGVEIVYAVALRVIVAVILLRLIALFFERGVEPFLQKFSKGERESKFIGAARQFARWVVLLYTALYIVNAFTTRLAQVDAVAYVTDALTVEQYLHNTLLQYIAFAVLAFASFVLANALYAFVLKWLSDLLSRRGEQLEQRWLTGMERPLQLVVPLLGGKLAASVLEGDVGTAVNAIVNVAIVLVFTWIAHRLTTRVFETYLLPIATRLDPNKAFDESVYSLSLKAARVVLWFTGGIIAVMSAGANPWPLLAGLSVGGVALAFALQETVASVISGILLYITRPFKVNDFIKTGDMQGWVKDIGLMRTKIATRKGTVILVPNKGLTGAVVETFSDETQAIRDTFNYVIQHEQSAERIENLWKVIKDAMATVPGLAKAPGAWAEEVRGDSIVIGTSWWVSADQAGNMGGIKLQLFNTVQTALLANGYKLGALSRTDFGAAGFPPEPPKA